MLVIFIWSPIVTNDIHPVTRQIANETFIRL